MKRITLLMSALLLMSCKSTEKINRTEASHIGSASVSSIATTDEKFASIIDDNCEIICFDTAVTDSAGGHPVSMIIRRERHSEQTNELQTADSAKTIVTDSLTYSSDKESRQTTGKGKVHTFTTGMAWGAVLLMAVLLLAKIYRTRITTFIKNMLKKLIK